MSAPTLFVLAADLTKMQVLASLDESDVGRIRPGQIVRFRVDAFPTEEFIGNVTQVRLQPTTVQNVVTYQTVIDVPNPELKLKPGMTANVNIEIARRADVLRVPNTALAVPADGRDLRGAGTDSPARQRRAAAADVAPAADPDTRNTQPAQPAPPPAAQQPAAAAAPGRSAAGGRRPAAAGDTGPRNSASRPAAQGEGIGPADGGSWRWSRRRWRRRRRGGRGNFAERMASMTPEEREQFMERMRARGFTPPADGQAAAASEGGGRGQGARDAASGARRRAGRAAPATASVERDDVRRAVWAAARRPRTFGQVWLNVDSKLQRVRLRLGITDGQQTELIQATGRRR